MISDRLTAKILGLLVLVFTMIIDMSMFMFTPAETRGRPGFAVIVLLPSLPFVALGAWLLWRSSKMKDDNEGASDR